MRNRAVFIDRDGVINRAIVKNGKPFSPATVDDFQILDGVGEALERLKTAGFVLIIVTNQPDIARGTLSNRTLAAFHNIIRTQLPVDDILVCPHDDADNCLCRKPKPGLLLQGQRRFTLSLEHSFMIGDRWRDVEAGQNARCRSILIEYRYDERQSVHRPDFTCESLSKAVDWILK